MHSITYLPGRHVLDIEVSGFWTMDDFDRFGVDLRAAVAAVPGPTPPASLYNYTAASIQSQAIVERMQQMARGVDPSRRIALYTEGRLARMQARRVAAECPGMAVFENRKDALEWLAVTAIGTRRRTAA